MWGAGLLSGLLGIGSGAFKVLALDYVMRLPMKVSTATSNFMIGITAAASAAVYFGRGDIHPVIAAPVALGVLLGASVGTALMGRLRNTTVRMLFLPVILYLAVSMIARGLGLGGVVTAVERIVSRILWWGGDREHRAHADRARRLRRAGGYRQRGLRHPAGRRAPSGRGRVTSSRRCRRWSAGLRQWPVDPLAVAAVGLLALVSTPVAAVLVTIPVFLSAGDRRYALISAFLAAALIGSLLIGGAG